MAENNVILDVDVAVDFLSNRPPHGQPAEQAVGTALHKGCRLWLVAACLPVLIERLEEALATSSRDEEERADPQRAMSRARDTVRGFLKTAGVLSSYGFDAEAALQTEHPMEALILRAADALGDDASILSRNPEFIRSDKRAIAPEDFVDRDDSSEVAGGGRCPLSISRGSSIESSQRWKRA